MNAQGKIQRDVLPIPDPTHVGVTTYDAKDPDTRYPPIEPQPARVWLSWVLRRQGTWSRGAVAAAALPMLREVICPRRMQILRGQGYPGSERR